MKDRTPFLRFNQWFGCRTKLAMPASSECFAFVDASAAPYTSASTLLHSGASSHAAGLAYVHGLS